MELTDDRIIFSRRTLIAGLVLTIVLMTVAFLTGMAVSSPDQGPRVEDTFEAEITAISADGDSVCLTNREDGENCGTPIFQAGEDFEVGSKVTATEVWLPEGEGSEGLAFYIGR